MKPFEAPLQRDQAAFATRALTMLVGTVLTGLFLSGCVTTRIETRPSDDQFSHETHTADVCGANPMNPTGVPAFHGQRWFIEVIGSEPACKDGKHGSPELHGCKGSDCLWKDGRLSPVPADGYEKWYLKPAVVFKRIRSARWYELSGGIKDKNQTFAIGSFRAVLIDEDGEIYLFANDAPFLYCNNYGSLRVRLTLLK